MHTPFTTTIVFAGTLHSGNDLPYSKTVLPILCNVGLKHRLRSLADILDKHPAHGLRIKSTYAHFRRLAKGAGHAARGKRGKVRLGPATFTSLFPADWEIRLDVQFFLATRGQHQLPDADNLLRPLCNALSFPPKGMRLPRVMAGRHYRTLAVQDHQFTMHQVQLTPFPGEGTPYDLTAIRFTALPPPHLQAARSLE